MEVDIVAQMEERSQTDIMISEVEVIIQNMIMKGLKDSRWADVGAESFQKASNAPTIVVGKVATAQTNFEFARVAARKIAVPLATRKPTQTTSRGTEALTNAEAANDLWTSAPSAATNVEIGATWQ